MNADIQTGQEDLAGNRANEPRKVPRRAAPRLKQRLQVVISKYGPESRLATGAFWSGLGSAVSRASVLVLNIATARLLLNEDFGKFGAIQSTIGVFASFAGLGLGLGATKFIAEFRDTEKHTAGKIVGLTYTLAIFGGTLCGALLFFSSQFLATQTLGDPSLTPLLQFSSFLLLLGTVAGGQIGVLSGLEAFRPITRLTTIANVISLPIAALLTYFRGLQGAVEALVFLQLCLVAAGFSIARKELRSRKISVCFGTCADELVRFAKFSLPAYFSGLLISPALFICTSIMVRQADGFSQLAMFNAAYQWRSLILFIPNVVVGSALPIMSNLYAAGRREEFSRLIRAKLIFSTGLTVVSAAMVAWAGPVIFRAYGSGFAPSAGLLWVLGAACVIDAVTNIVAYMLIGTGRVIQHFLLFLAWPSSLIASYAFLVPEMGAIGAARSHLIAQIAYGVVLLAYFFWRFRPGETHVLNR